MSVLNDRARVRGTQSTRSQDVVELRLPAEPAYLSVLRTATAGLAARLDFTLDEIEDLRIAVDEACALLLPDAVAGEPLTCRFVLDWPTARGQPSSAHAATGRPPATRLLRLDRPHRAGRRGGVLRARTAR